MSEFTRLLSAYLCHVSGLCPGGGLADGAARGRAGSWGGGHGGAVRALGTRTAMPAGTAPCPRRQRRRVAGADPVRGRTGQRRRGPASH